MRDPEEVRENANVALRSQAQVFEGRIDSAIDASTLLGFWPAVVAVGNAPAVLVDSVLERYSTRGWRIRRVTDTRDGDFIQVEAP